MPRWSKSVTFRVHCFNAVFTLKFFPVLTTIFLLVLLLSLGFWQLDRAHQKLVQFNQWQVHYFRPPLSISSTHQDIAKIQYSRLLVTGHYDLQHQFLWNNRIRNHRPGYEVITPFLPLHQSRWLLVNRGWISSPTLLSAHTQDNFQKIEGTILGPPRQFILENLPNYPGWPKTIQNIDISVLSRTLNHSLYPFVLLLSPEISQGFDRTWSFPKKQTAKHYGYAIQWFALALALVIIYLTINTHRNEDEKKEKTLRDREQSLD